MSEVLRHWVTGALRNFGLTLMSNGRYERLDKNSQDLSRLNAAIDFIMTLPSDHSAELLRLARKSKAQLFQDLFVLSELKFKRSGFFVEFGATNGIDLSNTFLLEKQFAWTGILAEPARVWQVALRKNRECMIESACVWRESGASVTFNAADMGELSTIDAFSSSDHHAQRRGSGEKYDVPTISLADLLEKFNAPREIDFLSVDTEGSELEILRGFDFNKYRFKVITVEHNFTAQRDEIFTLLTSNGYMRKCEGISEFDDWYVKSGAAR